MPYGLKTLLLGPKAEIMEVTLTAQVLVFDAVTVRGSLVNMHLVYYSVPPIV